MADSNSSHQCKVAMHALNRPYDQKEKYKDQLIIDIQVSRSIVFYNPKNSPQERREYTFRSTSKQIFMYEQQNFLSCSPSRQRKLVQTMIERLDIPFSLEKFHWVEKNEPKFENLESSLTRLINIAHDCVQRNDMMVIILDEFHTLNPNEYYKVHRILDGWLVDCKNGVNDIYCLKDYPMETKRDLYYKKKWMFTNEMWNEDKGRECCCSVCLNELRKGTTVIRMSSCSHKFHSSCILKWFLINPTCPLCRSELFQEGTGVCQRNLQTRKET